jgi:hypothetical protein
MLSDGEAVVLAKVYALILSWPDPEDNLSIQDIETAPPDDFDRAAGEAEEQTTNSVDAF